jgi:hypothetical protein
VVNVHKELEKVSFLLMNGKLYYTTALPKEEIGSTIVVFGEQNSAKIAPHND